MVDGTFFAFAPDIDAQRMRDGQRWWARARGLGAAGCVDGSCGWWHDNVGDEALEVAPVQGQHLLQGWIADELLKVGLSC